MKELEYPFDPELILKKRRAFKKQLEQQVIDPIPVKIAVLGGSTVDDIISCAELFLLDSGIKPTFYRSEYNRWWEDGVFSNEQLEQFSPDIVYICTSVRNIGQLPDVTMTAQTADRLADDEYKRFEQVWKALGRFNCTIIQNNFDPCVYAFGGSYDCWGTGGGGYFISRLNMRFAEYARAHKGFYLLDLDRTAAEIGLNAWHDEAAWYMYKYPCARKAMPYAAYKLALIVRSIYGKNRKLIALDCDNTLWGGVIGDDGAEGIAIGQETGEAQAFYEFQRYIKRLAQAGTALAICSKNDEQNALAGLNRPDGVLRPDDFALIKADWERKDKNLSEILAALSLTPSAAVFIDDNPAERGIVKMSIPQAAVPEIGEPEDYIRVISGSGFFEITELSADDLKRGEMYRTNAKRAALQADISDYGEYLKSLEMSAEIAPFEPMYIQRITQLTNKSNQFNLTTKRCTLSEMERIMNDPEYITLYGRLTDKFGDNGVVSVIAAKRRGETLDIELWLMSCRVLKRDMELAMLDSLIKKARDSGITRLTGRYIPTAKNSMVSEHYKKLGFTQTDTHDDGTTVWELEINGYENKNRYIALVQKG